MQNYIGSVVRLIQFELFTLIYNVGAMGPSPLGCYFMAQEIPGLNPAQGEKIFFFRQRLEGTINTVLFSIEDLGYTDHSIWYERPKWSGECEDHQSKQI